MGFLDKIWSFSSALHVSASPIHRNKWRLNSIRSYKMMSHIAIYWAASIYNWEDIKTCRKTTIRGHPSVHLFTMWWYHSIEIQINLLPRLFLITSRLLYHPPGGLDLVVQWKKPPHALSHSVCIINNGNKDTNLHSPRW